MNPTPPPVPPQSGPSYSPRTSALAIWSLVLGALGVVPCFTVFTGIPGAICGHIALSRIKRSGGRLKGEGLAIAGMILGYVSIAVFMLLAIIAIPNFTRARAIAQRNFCIENLRKIDDAKQKWAMDNKKQATDVPTEKDLAPYLPNGMPKCPNGGTYSINPNNQPPTCSVPGHELK